MESRSVHSGQTITAFPSNGSTLNLRPKCSQGNLNRDERISLTFLSFVQRSRHIYPCHLAAAGSSDRFAGKYLLIIVYHFVPLRTTVYRFTTVYHFVPLHTAFYQFTTVYHCYHRVPFFTTTYHVLPVYHYVPLCTTVYWCTTVYHCLPVYHCVGLFTGCSDTILKRLLFHQVNMIQIA